MLKIHVILHLVGQMQSAMVVFVPAYQNIKGILIVVVDQNVYRVLTVPKIKLVYVTNALTLVQEHVVKMPNATLLTISQCVPVNEDTQEALSSHALKYQVLLF